MFAPVLSDHFVTRLTRLLARGCQFKGSGRARSRQYPPINKHVVDVDHLVEELCALRQRRQRLRVECHVSISLNRSVVSCRPFLSSEIAIEIQLADVTSAMRLV